MCHDERASYLELFREILNHLIKQSPCGLLCTQDNEIHSCITVQKQTLGQYSYTHYTLQYTRHLAVILIPVE